MSTVVFTKNNARILVDGQPFDHSLPHVEKANLTYVRGIPPHHWKLSDIGDIVPMEPNEVAKREEHHAKYGSINSIEAKNPLITTNKWLFRLNVLLMISLLIAGIYLSAKNGLL